MEAGAALSFQLRSLVGGEGARRRPAGFARLGFREVRRSGEFVSLGCMEERRPLRLSMRDPRRSGVLIEPRVSCSCDNRGAAGAGSEDFHAYVDEALLLKRKAEDIAPYLNGRCIYLVGMMGSGKTTVGKILSEVLGYSFFDSDKLVEQAVGISSVAQIFKEHSEAFFRDNETNVLRDFSSMCRLVIATGGGAVIRPINWRYMRQGLTIWLDVPLDALARRITAVGTASRPLLHAESGDPYTKAFMRLTTLFEERGKAYANADARVCLEQIAAKQGHGDASALTPTAIAIEALAQIESFLTEEATIKRSAYLRG